jgi:leucyl aminopeptidase
LIEEAERGITRGEAYAAGTLLARELVNLRANYLTPRALAEKVLEVADRYRMSSLLLDEVAIQEKGMGLLWAVGKPVSILRAW